MKELFLNAVNACISASWLILAVLLLRLVFKKAPKWIIVLLWGIVALRLLCPFSLESPLSLIPSSQTLPDRVISGSSFNIQSGIAPVDNYVNDYLDAHYYEGVTVPAHQGASVMGVLGIIWAAGVILLLAYAIFSYIRLSKKVSTAVLLEGNIFQSEGISSPFALGLFRPKIYLPFNMPADIRDYVITHERAHISRRDHIWKPLGFLLLAVYWFNPLIWLSYILLCRDIELACDEKSVKLLGSERKADYSQALLVCSAERHIAAACPLSFAETGVKERVKHVLNYKKPTLWIIIAALVICAVAAVCFLTNPPSDAPITPGNTPAYTVYAEGARGSVDINTLNNRSTLLFQGDDGSCSISFALLEGKGLKAVQSDATTEVLITDEGGESLGTMLFYPLATYDNDALGSIDPTANSLPMQVFATVALSNHVYFDNYTVLSHTDSGAAATAVYAWQNLNDENYDSAADIPFNESDCVLAYDYAASPYFVFIVSYSSELSLTNGLNKIAETLQFSSVDATPEVSPGVTTEPIISPEPPAVSSTPDTRLDDIEKFFNSMPVNGMLLSEYSDPRDMSLYEVLYQCEDDSVDYLSVNEAYKSETDNEVETDITYMSVSALDKLLTSLTGYGIADMRNLEGVTYLESLDVYCVMHGDTNHSPVKCVSLDELGDGLIAVTCRSTVENGDLFFRSEEGEYLFAKEILVTLRETSGGYQFVSNKMVN